MATEDRSALQLEALGAASHVVDSDQATPSPTNGYVAFTRRTQWDRVRDDDTFTLTEVWIRDSRTGEKRVLVDWEKLSPKWSDRAGEGFRFADILWSPDSQWLVLSDASHFFRGVIVVQIATGRVFEIAGRAPAWSPDSRMLALCKGTDLGVNSGILILDASSAKIDEHLSDIPVYPGLSWGGSRLVFETVTDQGNEFFSYDPRGGYATLRRVAKPTEKVDR